MMYYLTPTQNQAFATELMHTLFPKQVGFFQLANLDQELTDFIVPAVEEEAYEKFVRPVLNGLQLPFSESDKKTINTAKSCADEHFRSVIVE